MVEIPIFAEFDIEFIRRMNALVEEFKLLSQDDVRKFWREFKPRVYEDYCKARKWDQFQNLIEDIIEESIEKQTKRTETDE